MEKSLSWSCLPWRYLSYSAVVLSQMTHPILFIGKLTRKQVVAVSAINTEVAMARKERQRQRAAARRPTATFSSPKPDILEAYFSCGHSSRQIKERLDPRQNVDRLGPKDTLLQFDTDS